MEEKELAGTKALGQAVLGIVERAEQTHAKVRQAGGRLSTVLWLVLKAVIMRVRMAMITGSPQLHCQLQLTQIAPGIIVQAACVTAYCATERAV